MDSELLDAIRDLVADLARGRLAEVEADGRAGRLSATELRSAIRDHGRTLVALPDVRAGVDAVKAEILRADAALTPPAPLVMVAHPAGRG